MKQRQGFILLLVVSVLIGAAAVLALASLKARMGAKGVSISADLAQMRAASTATLARAVLGLSDAEPLYADGRVYHFAINGVQVDYQVLDTRGLLDLNGARADLLAALFEFLGQSIPDAETLGAAIEDWRDADDDPKPRGAEKRAYRNAGLPPPGNRPFYDVTEVRGVLGMNAALYAAAAPYFYAGPGRAKPLALYAPPQVLKLLDTSPAEQRDILDRRRAGDPPAEKESRQSPESPKKNGARSPRQHSGQKPDRARGQYWLLVQAHMQNGARAAQRIGFATGPGPGDYAILSRRTMAYGQAANTYGPDQDNASF